MTTATGSGPRNAERSRLPSTDFGGRPVTGVIYCGCSGDSARSIIIARSRYNRERKED